MFSYLKNGQMYVQMQGKQLISFVSKQNYVFIYCAVDLFVP